MSEQRNAREARDELNEAMRQTRMLHAPKADTRTLSWWRCAGCSWQGGALGWDDHLDNEILDSILSTPSLLLEALGMEQVGWVASSDWAGTGGIICARPIQPSDVPLYRFPSALSDKTERGEGR
jgi:hypothetical protein